MVGYGSAGRSRHASRRVTTLARSLTYIPSKVFTFRSQYWLWCPVIAPIVGALGAFHVPKLVCPLVRLIIPFAVGVFLYDSLLFTGSESLLNKP